VRGEAGDDATTRRLGSVMKRALDDLLLRWLAGTLENLEFGIWSDASFAISREPSDAGFVDRRSSSVVVGPGGALTLARARGCESPIRSSRGPKRRLGASLRRFSRRGGRRG
jgi:hypothetical protein